MPHFHVIYAVEDRDFVQPVLDQLEKAWSSVCADLGCNPAFPTYTLSLIPALPTVAYFGRRA